MYEVVAADMESLFIRWRPKTFWLFRHQGRDPLDFYPLSVFVVKGTQTTHSPRFTTKRRLLKALCLWLLKRKLLNRALVWICFVITDWNICTKGCGSVDRYPINMSINITKLTPNQQLVDGDNRLICADQHSMACLWKLVDLRPIVNQDVDQLLTEYPWRCHWRLSIDTWLWMPYVCTIPRQKTKVMCKDFLPLRTRKK